MDRVLIAATDITPQPVRWCWPGRIPLRAVTILDGDPGLGKSAITYDLTGRISSGQPMPNCTEAMPPSGVVLLQAEDSLAGTILPNLQACGADLGKVRLYDKERFAVQPFVLPNNLPLIETAIVNVGAKLLVIDPLTAFCLDTNTNADAAVRRVLGPLAVLAERNDLAVLVVRHRRKTAARNPLYGGAGSIGIIATARSALLVGHNPSSENKHQHILALNKSNLTDAESLSHPNHQTSQWGNNRQWLGPSKYSAGDITAAQANADEHTAEREAMYVLYSILAEGGVSAREVIQGAKDAGISERTLRRAKKDLRVESVKKGSGRGISLVLAPRRRRRVAPATQRQGHRRSDRPPDSRRRRPSTTTIWETAQQ